MKNRISGVFNILATPFDKASNVDEKSLKNLVEFQIDKGAHGLTILGVLGEASKLKVKERRLVVDTVMDSVRSRIPVVVGTSHPDLSICIELSRAAFSAGAEGVMIAPPKMENPTDQAVLNLYRKIADKTDQPVIVQDFPPVNGIIMSPHFLGTLAEKIPNIRHLKLEDPPLMQKISAIKQCTDRYKIFGGLGGMFFLEELKRGCSGTMTGFAFTEILVAVFNAYHNQDMGRAERIFDEYLPLIRFENQPVINLSIRKALLCKRGAIGTGFLRKPFEPIDTRTHEEIKWVLKRVGIHRPEEKIRF